MDYQTQMMNIQQFLDFISTWNIEKTNDNEYFDDIFNIDGIPLWWFYRPMVIKNMLPSKFGTLTDMYLSIQSKKSLLEKLSDKFRISAYKKALLINEKRKKEKVNNHKTSDKNK